MGPWPNWLLLDCGPLEIIALTGFGTGSREGPTFSRAEHGFTGLAAGLKVRPPVLNLHRRQGSGSHMTFLYPTLSSSFVTEAGGNA